MPHVTNPYPNAHAIGNGPVVEPGESVEVTVEEAESLVEQGWEVTSTASPAKGRKADVPEVTEPSAETDPALSGEERE